MRHKYIFIYQSYRHPKHFALDKQQKMKKQSIHNFTDQKEWLEFYYIFLYFVADLAEYSSIFPTLPLTEWFYIEVFSLFRGTWNVNQWIFDSTLVFSSFNVSRKYNERKLEKLKHTFLVED